MFRGLSQEVLKIVNANTAGDTYYIDGEFQISRSGIGDIVGNYSLQYSFDRFRE